MQQSLPVNVYLAPHSLLVNKKDAESCLSVGCCNSWQQFRSGAEKILLLYQKYGILARADVWLSRKCYSFDKCNVLPLFKFPLTFIEILCGLAQQEK